MSDLIVARVRRPHGVAGTKGGNMLRRSKIFTAAALALCCSLAPAAASDGDVPPPPSSMAAAQAEDYRDLRATTPAGGSRDLRSPDAQDAAAHRGLYEAERSPHVLARDYGSPDAVDAARAVPPATASASPGPFTESERKLVESPEVQRTIDRVRSEIRATRALVTVTESPSGGFDWGDAGIGAAGMLALFCIAGGSALLISGRRRRHGFKVATD